MGFMKVSSEQLVLASGSVVRRRLLEGLGLIFEVLLSEVDEGVEGREFMREGDGKGMSLHLGKKKALSVSRKRGSAYVVGGDQVLECRGCVFRKARSMGELREQLRVLSGQEHYLHTSVVLARGGEVLWSAVESPLLKMRVLGERFIEGYCAEVGALGLEMLAGGAIEGLGLHLMERIEGDIFAIQGLPLLGLLEVLRREGVVVS